MSLSIIHCDRIAPQPWKNGGGQTRELFVWPPGGPWSLRISVADIRAAGPFSPFPSDIRVDTDIVEITRTWTFTSSDKLTATGSQ